FAMPSGASPVPYGAAIPMALGSSGHAAPVESETEFHVSLGEPEAASSTGPDNVRVFPTPASTTDASLQLARHVTRLLTEARQQIQAAARDAAAQAVAAERKASAEQWEHKVAETREQLSQQLAAAIDRVQEEATARSRAAHDAAISQLQEELPKRLAPQLEEITRGLAGKLSEEGHGQREAHQEQVAAAGARR